MEIEQGVPREGASADASQGAASNGLRSDIEAGETAAPQRLSKTLAATIAEELRRLVQYGELAPGQRLRQTEIARKFGVSTTPVREAFTSLAREGLLRHDPHKGIVVFEPSISNLREYYEIRTVLEPWATELAAHERTPSELAAIEDLVAQMRRAYDSVEYHDLNREFHRQIYECARRPRLAAMIKSLRDGSEVYLRLNATQPGNESYIAQVHEEHEAIAGAIRARDARRARELMETHLRHSRDQLEQLVRHLLHE